MSKEKKTRGKEQTMDGDGGSIVTNMDNKPVGMVIAGTSQGFIASPISNIQRLLDIQQYHQPGRDKKVKQKRDEAHKT